MVKLTLKNLQAWVDKNTYIRLEILSLELLFQQKYISRMTESEYIKLSIGRTYDKSILLHLGYTNDITGRMLLDSETFEL